MNRVILAFLTRSSEGTHNGFFEVFMAGMMTGFAGGFRAGFLAGFTEGFLESFVEGFFKLFFKSLFEGFFNNFFGGFFDGFFEVFLEGFFELFFKGFFTISPSLNLNSVDCPPWYITFTIFFQEVSAPADPSCKGKSGYLLSHIFQGLEPGKCNISFPLLSQRLFS
jgi:hypothetical protein